MPESPHAIALDLELDHAKRLAMVGAASTEGATFAREPRGAAAPTTDALRELDAFVGEAQLWCGHNVIWHDRPWLREHAPQLRLLQRPVVDTLVLSTLAFAEHPYHALCKTHKPTRSARNDPVEDSRRSLELLAEAVPRLRALANANPTFGRVLVALAVSAMEAIDAAAGHGMALALAPVGPPSVDLATDLRAFFADRVCIEAATTLLATQKNPLELLFAVTWLRVAGSTTQPSSSILMPWVRERFPGVVALLQQLRDVPCARGDCTWCRAMHDPRGHLQRWFGHQDFRPEPRLADGQSAQAAIVAAGFADRPLLALLPTGGGKSLCFQLPAIARALRRGCLTIVVSPLQSLMHDQVDNFTHKTSLTMARALTGQLTPPERREALEAVRSGACSLLYVSPEQLRNPSFAAAITMREIGAFVFDEAHCLSKWGHDFRPDYLYASRFVREHAERTHTPVPPVVCVTATAKPEVIDELVRHFREMLGQELAVFDGHAPRQNLELAVEDVRGHDKLPRLVELVAAELARARHGSVIVYTATRKDAERTAKHLEAAGIAADAFHAGLEVPRKKEVQARFLGGERRVVCATNAFGMGIDKADVRLVVHFAVPGSLEAYVQEVGRAGRDGLPARAVLLHDPADVEQQFRLAAQSRLDVRDLQAILRRVRGMAKPARRAATTDAAPGDATPGEHEVVCTTGEILRDEATAEQVDPSDRGASTKVVTALAWLERGQFLRRDHNETAVFQGRPRVPTMAVAREQVAKLDLPAAKAAAWLAVLERLYACGPDQGLGSDELLGIAAVAKVADVDTGLHAGRRLLQMLFEMQQKKLLTSGMQMTAFVRHGIADASRDRLAAVCRLERQLLAALRELEPDAERDRHYPLHLPSLTQRLVQELPDVTAEQVRTLLAATADRGQHAGPKGSGLRVTLYARDRGTALVHGDWDAIEATARRRHALAELCLATMLQALQPAGVQGKALLVEFTLEDLQAAIDRDLLLRSEPSRDPIQELEHTLLFLHRTEVLVLHKGLAVFRQAMTLRLPVGSHKRRYTHEDFEPMAEHQRGRTRQVHFMAEFAERMQTAKATGLAFLDDYFRLPEAEFLARHFARRRGELERATSAASWHAIVGGLTEDQRRIVTAGEDRSMLVLAGPGSGKTRVVVHRCAWLLRVRRVPAAAILVLCFNRSAALELRTRLRALVGDDANGVLVQTYHGMAARLVGRSPAVDLDAGAAEATTFDTLLDLAIARLEPNAAPPGLDGPRSEPDADDLRDRLLQGFRHILVDEYQDIDEKQYRFVSAIAGRQLADSDRKLTVLAVGDDDQNVYQFRGSDVAFLRRFERDYGAERVPLVENHRSTAHIVAVANEVIALNPGRLKADTPVRIDKQRASEPPGGPFAAGDPVTQGRVHVLQVANPAAQGEAVRDALQRLRGCEPGLLWTDCAVLSPRHGLLGPVRSALEAAGIPCRVRIDNEHSYSLFRLREVQEFLAAIDEHPGELLTADGARTLLARLQAARPRERTFDLVATTLSAFVDEHGAGPWPKTEIEPFFGELLLEQRRERTLGDGVLLGTVHGSKGAEYRHVLVLDGDWRPRDGGDWQERRRVYYVGMTRAKHTLTLLQLPGGAPWLPSLHGPAVARSTSPVRAPTHGRTTQRQLVAQKDLYWSFAGQSAQHRAIAEHIADLACGDALAFGVDGERTTLVDADGRCVGMLSSSGGKRWAPLLERVVAVRCAAVLVRRVADEAVDYRDRVRRPAWHVVVPEVQFLDDAR